MFSLDGSKHEESDSSSKSDSYIKTECILIMDSEWPKNSKIGSFRIFLVNSTFASHSAKNIFF